MSKSSVQFVHTPALLTPLLEELEQSPCVGLDTEFISEGAYEPQLCLVQLATEHGIWIVDPLALKDLARMWELLTAPGREVVALAAREEIRFCLRYAGRAPSPLFDPQIAAGLVGHGYPLSHTNLVRKVLGARVSGGESFTDWRQRPLSDRQLEYAADDVRYLLAVRERLLQDAGKLSRDGQDRAAWIGTECARLVERIVGDEREERWWKVSGGAGLNRRELAILREIWRWRDATARRANVPARRIMRDELLVEIAKRQPRTTADLFALRGLDKGSAKNSGAELVRAVEAALALPDSELPRSMRRDDPPQVQVLTQLLSVVVNALAEDCRVDAALLGTTADIQDTVRWAIAGANESEPPQLLAGWRAELTRGPVLGLLRGETALSVADVRRSNPLRVERLAGTKPTASS